MNDRKFHRVLERLPIIPALKREIINQESKWGNPDAPKKPIGDRLDFIAKHVEAAKQAASAGKNEKAVEELRFLTSLAIATLIAQTTRTNVA